MTVIERKYSEEVHRIGDLGRGVVRKFIDRIGAHASSMSSQSGIRVFDAADQHVELTNSEFGLIMGMLVTEAHNRPEANALYQKLRDGMVCDG